MQAVPFGLTAAQFQALTAWPQSLCADWGAPGKNVGSVHCCYLKFSSFSSTSTSQIVECFLVCLYLTEIALSISLVQLCHCTMRRLANLLTGPQPASPGCWVALPGHSPVPYFFTRLVESPKQPGDFSAQPKCWREKGRKGELWLGPWSLGSLKVFSNTGESVNSQIYFRPNILYPGRMRSHLYSSTHF